MNFANENDGKMRIENPATERKESLHIEPQHCNVVNKQIARNCDGFPLYSRRKKKCRRK